ncbi:Spo0E family sporulation regulatory protein-aspartic acid phosphatase [Ammoniphilus sp. 3BR4]|uniref:Spo0E family sporulation regulatory protein-aspartic acid phosphatase n=1 Tax=Ammoniphilus sp. 3BR4 TaxID=3158265 RepID=UPI0034676F59
MMKLVNLKHKLENEREIMHELALKKGLSDPEVVKVSQEIDQLVLNLQKMVASLGLHRKEEKITAD